MSAANIVDVILFTRQAELTKIATEHLKMKGISNILTVTEAKACSEALKRLPKGLLLIDWQVGPAEVAVVLGHNRKTASGPMRPIMLVAEQVTNQIIATAAEYAVSQIFTEAITKRNLGGRLSNMLLVETLADEIKKALGDVHKARLDGDLKKGSKIYVEGRLDTQMWEKDGHKNYRTSIIVEEFTLLDGGGQKAAPRQQQAEIDPDEIPF